MQARTRWTLYAVAGAATLVAMRFGGSESARDDAVVAAAPRHASPAAVAGERGGRAAVSTTAATTASTSVAPVAAGGLDLERMTRPAASAPTGDPFSAPSWQPAPAPVVAQPVPMETEPALPPLPFVYMGRWIEGGRTTVILDRAGHNYFVRTRDKIDGAFTVVAIDDKQVVLEDLATRTRQSISTTPRADAAPATSADPGAAPPGSSADSQVTD